MKSHVIVHVALLCLIVSPTTTIGGWLKPSEVSNEEMLMNTGHVRFYADKFNFGDSKIWKCTYNNGSGAAVSISYPSPPQSPSRKPPAPSAPPSTPKMSPPPPKPSPPRPTPKKSPPPPPKPSPPPRNPSPLTPNKSSPPPKTSPPIRLSPPTPKKSPPPPNESSPAPSPPAESTPRHHYQNPNPWGHFISCMSEFGPSAICKQQMQVSYYTGRFRVSDDCCNLIVNMRNECTDVILGFYTDPFFVPLIRCTCHVKN